MVQFFKADFDVASGPTCTIGFERAIEVFRKPSLASEEVTPADMEVDDTKVCQTGGETKRKKSKRKHAEAASAPM